MDNWGWKTVIALIAFPAPLFVAGYLGAGPLVRHGIRDGRAALRRRKAEKAPEAVPVLTE